MLVFFMGLWLTACQQEQPSTEENKQEQQEENDQQSEKEDDQDGTEAESDAGTGEEEETTEDQSKEETTDKHIAKVDEDTGLHVVDNPASVEVYVNKQRKLPDGFETPNLVVPDVAHYAAEGDPKRQMQQVAAHALEQLFVEAEQQGIGLVAVSGYRSYERQAQIYQNNVKNNGQEHADKYSAKPGTSEHQTGLAMDVASATETGATLLEPSFSQTNAGEWLAENAHLYGFIIRYPEGKRDVTGYSYEPWHIRYVGETLATEIYHAGITLEEYFGYDY